MIKANNDSGIIGYDELLTGADTTAQQRFSAAIQYLEQRCPDYTVDQILVAAKIIVDCAIRDFGSAVVAIAIQEHAEAIATAGADISEKLKDIAAEIFDHD